MQEGAWLGGAVWGYGCHMPSPAGLIAALTVVPAHEDRDLGARCDRTPWGFSAYLAVLESDLPA